MMKKSVKKIIVIVILVLILLIILSGIGCLIFYFNNLKPVNKESDSQKISIEIKSGMSVNEIASELEKLSIIKNKLVFKIYLKINNISNTMQAGKYTFENGKDDVEQVAKKICSGEILDETIKLTFIEGKSIKNYYNVIADNTNNSYDDVVDTLNDQEFINELIQKYWFLTDEITDSEIYYSLEGYLMPDTYIFENEDVSVKEIIYTILNNTNKILSKYKDDIESNRFSVHELLTLASILEQEGYELEDRQMIAGIFINRLDKKMNLGSDVTTYYALGKEMKDGDLTSADLLVENAYNTRANNMAGKLPIGPICNPSETSIIAAINPTESEYYYFVSDKNGKAYYSKNYTEHQKIIKELKEEGLWYTYDN